MDLTGEGLHLAIHLLFPGFQLVFQFFQALLPLGQFFFLLFQFFQGLILGLADLLQTVAKGEQLIQAVSLGQIGQLSPVVEQLHPAYDLLILLPFPIVLGLLLIHCLTGPLQLVFQKGHLLAELIDLAGDLLFLILHGLALLHRLIQEIFLFFQFGLLLG